MKRKIFNILVALAMVLGLSMIPAIATGTTNSTNIPYRPDVVYRLGDGTSGTATWSTIAQKTGSYSVYLTKAAGTYDSTYVDFVPTGEVTLADFVTADGTGDKEFSWYHYTANLAVSNQSQMELRFTAPDGDADIVLDITAMPLQNYDGTGAWVEQSLVQATSGLLYYGTNAADVDYSWTTGTGHDDLLKTVATIRAAIIANTSADAVAVLDALVLTRVRIELWDADVTKTSYIDTVTIAGITYDLEPVESNTGYTLGDGTVGAASWSTTKTHSGAYSANLAKTGAGAYTSTYIDFVPTEEVTLADFGAADSDPEWSWWHYTSAGVYNHSQMELRFTAPDGDADIALDITAMPLQGYNGTDGWVQQSLVQATSGLLYYGTNAAGTSYYWQTAGGGDNALETVANIIGDIEANVGADADEVLEALVLTRVRIELYDAEAAKNSYIDDVTIAGTAYDLEPIVMDAAYYQTGGTVNVTVYNGSATSTIFGYAYSDSIDPSLPITYDLIDEDSTGVFTSSFDLVGSDAEDDELLVGEGDTIYVKCTANWGADAQTLSWVTTAIIDDTEPVITIVSPVASANITDNTPAIAATLTDDVSGIDDDTILMMLDDEEVEAAYDSVSGALTYTIEDELEDGSYTITVDVSDIAGNEATESWSFNVDTVDPVITDQAAEPPVVLPDVETEVIFTATVTDATSGVATVTIDLTDVGGDDETAMLDDGELDDVAPDDGIYTATADITETTEDDFELTITATDEAGNAVATDHIHLVVSSDIEAPVITDPAIAYTAGYSSARVGDSVTISATVIDDVGMGTVTADNSTAFAAHVHLLDDGAGVDEEPDDDIYTGTVAVAADTPAGDYTIIITATDAKGNEATDESLTLIVSSGITSYDIDLVEGWNLISTPLIPDDSDIDVILADITDNISVVWAYVYDDQGDPTWKVWGSGESDLDEIVDGQGYWIEMTEDNTLTISGVELPAPPDAPHAYNIYEGWNLIGFKSVDAKTGTVYLAGDAYADFVRMYGYDTEDAVYTTVLIGGSLQPGQGYWLAVSADGTIYP
jgi:hypothetical protein